MSLNWRDLHALACCSQLSSLHVHRCVLPATAPATHPLAALASLKELHVVETRSSLAQGLTQLTSVCMHSEAETLSQLARPRLDGMQQLQQVDLQGKDSDVPAAVVAQLFSAAPNLRSLRLGNLVRQQAFDALLAHGTQLTRLTCHNLYLLEDRSQSACTWKELMVTWICCVPRTLAYLPLHSLSRVCLGPKGTWSTFEIPSACPYLSCHLYPDPGILLCTPAEIQAALINLGTCPAWQDSGPRVCVSLASQGQQQTVELCMQSISALAALSGRKVHLLIDSEVLHMTGGVVELLGATLGYSTTYFTLSACTIHHDFWPAVWRHLPGLQGLRISSYVRGAVSCSDIAAFCSHATRPLSLKLGRHLFSQVGPSEQLEQQCRSWGVPQVTIAEIDSFIQ
jgi:hypothetical protein